MMNMANKPEPQDDSGEWVWRDNTMHAQMTEIVAGFAASLQMLWIAYLLQGGAEVFQGVTGVMEAFNDPDTKTLVAFLKLIPCVMTLVVAWLLYDARCAFKSTMDASTQDHTKLPLDEFTHGNPHTDTQILKS